ncbi:hypothetical protein [Phenylobacterium sp.]|uniref:hypothetical protein n=1 Tax=Phenylobacterium sp. TaxID=1871053 RepID=UPI002CEC6BB7|nr:hypothetical protein [Phenylobacterium sp.]HLZ73541.1 hypothetical protein [Phenylobacterium sp.]
MDIHKPKPWHGVREFLKEYVIIVVGVLTALGAEAIVENLHERRLSAEAKEAVRDEINVDLTNVARRAQWEPCLARRLDEISALLDRADAGEAFKPPAEVGGPLLPTIYTQRWTAATAGGRTSLLSSDEQRAYGRVYNQLDHLDAKQGAEAEAWLRLGALNTLRHLTPEAIYDQRLAVAKARQMNQLVQSNIRQIRVFAGRLGIKGDANLQMAPSEAARVPTACMPFYGPGK